MEVKLIDLTKEFDKQGKKTVVKSISLISKDEQEIQQPAQLVLNGAKLGSKKNHAWIGDDFSINWKKNSWNEKNSRLSAATTNKSSSMWSLSIAYIKSHTAPRRVSLVSVPSSTMVIGLLQFKSFFQSSKMLANLWFVIMICSSISEILSISSNILPKIVFSPIFNNGFGKFLVKSPNLVAYPAAITTHFIFIFFI